MIGFLQLVGVLFGLLMAYLTFVAFKKKQLSRPDFVFWELIWLAVIAIAFFSTFAFTESEIFVKTIGAVRLLDFLTVAGFVVLFLVAFFTFKSVRQTQAKVEQIVEAVALKGLKEKKK